MSELDEFADVRFVLWQCDGLRHFAIDRSVSRIQRPHQIIEIKLAVEFGGELLPIGGRAHDRPSHRLGTRATPRTSGNVLRCAIAKRLEGSRFVALERHSILFVVRRGSTRSPCSRRLSRITQREDLTYDRFHEYCKCGPNKLSSAGPKRDDAISR